ncbi:MAG: EamA family transporter [bacterium]
MSKYFIPDFAKKFWVIYNFNPYIMTAKSTRAYKILLIIGILIGTCAQLLMKKGVESIGGVHLADSPLIVEITKIFTNPYVIIGLFVIAVSSIIWLHVLSHLDLSFAYPFVSISYIIILFFGWLVFHESVTPLRIAGVALIGSGVILISKSEVKKESSGVQSS